MEMILDRALAIGTESNCLYFVRRDEFLCFYHSIHCRKFRQPIFNLLISIVFIQRRLSGTQRALG
jgi:hypothetical protein